jgi:hypothetical protein
LAAIPDKIELVYLVALNTRAQSDECVGNKVMLAMRAATTHATMPYSK